MSLDRLEDKLDGVLIAVTEAKLSIQQLPKLIMILIAVAGANGGANVTELIKGALASGNPEYANYRIEGSVNPKSDKDSREDQPNQPSLKD